MLTDNEEVFRAGWDLLYSKQRSEKELGYVLFANANAHISKVNAKVQNKIVTVRRNKHRSGRFARMRLALMAELPAFTEEELRLYY